MLLNTPITIYNVTTDEHQARITDLAWFYCSILGQPKYPMIERDHSENTMTVHVRSEDEVMMQTHLEWMKNSDDTDQIKLQMMKLWIFNLVHSEIENSKQSQSPTPEVPEITEPQYVFCRINTLGNKTYLLINSPYKYNIWTSNIAEATHRPMNEIIRLIIKFQVTLSPSNEYLLVPTASPTNP